MRKFALVLLSLSMAFMLGAEPAPATCENAAPVVAAASPANDQALTPGVKDAKPMSDWVYEACFSLTGTSPCYDVYQHNGGYWLCSACGTTTNPSENKCRRLQSWELFHGYWCS